MLWLQLCNKLISSAAPCLTHALSVQKSDRATDANSNALSPLPSRSLGPRGSIGLESGQSVSSASAARAPSVPHSGLPTSRTNHDAADTEPESCTGTIDKSTIELPPGQGSNPSQVDIRSASTLSDARSKHSPSTPWQLPRRDPASLPRAAHGNQARPLRPLHSSTHIQFASSILETFPHGFPDGQPSPSREMRGTGGIHQLALASAPQLTRELMDALPPEPKSGTSPISTLGAPYRHDVSDTLTAGATDISPRAGESAMAVLQHIPGRSFRRVPADTTEGGSSTGVGSNATPAHQGHVETTGPGSSAGIASTAPPLRWGPVDTTGPGSSPGVASHATASRWGPIDVPEPGSSAGVISHATLSRRGPIDVTEPGSSAGVASHTAPSRWGPIDVAEPGSSTGVASHATPSRWEPVDITEPGYSAGVASHATPPRRGDSLPLAELAPADRVASHTHSVHLSSLDRGGGSGSEIEVLDPHNMGVYTPVMHASGTAGAVPSVPFHANRGPPRHVLPPVGASMLARGSTPNARWLQPRNQDAVGGPWRMHSSQGSEATSGDISGTPDTDMTQTQPQLPLPPGNMGGNSASVGGNSANIGASPFLSTPRRMAMGGQGAQLAVAGDRAEGARAVEDAPGAAMHALNRYRARVAAQVQAGASSGTDTASGLAGGTATMGDLSAGQSSWLDGTGDLTPPPPHASTDEKLDHIDAQLDSLTRTTVLNLYELFGGNERRRGGAHLLRSRPAPAARPGRSRSVDAVYPRLHLGGFSTVCGDVQGRRSSSSPSACTHARSLRSSSSSTAPTLRPRPRATAARTSGRSCPRWSATSTTTTARCATPPATRCRRASSSSAANPCGIACSSRTPTKPAPPRCRTPSRPPLPSTPRPCCRRRPLRVSVWVGVDAACVVLALLRRLCERSTLPPHAAPYAPVLCVDAMAYPVPRCPGPGFAALDGVHFCAPPSAEAHVFWGCFSAP